MRFLFRTNHAFPALWYSYVVVPEIKHDNFGEWWNCFGMTTTTILSQSSLGLAPWPLTPAHVSGCMLFSDCVVVVQVLVCLLIGGLYVCPSLPMHVWVAHMLLMWHLLVHDSVCVCVCVCAWLCVCVCVCVCDIHPYLLLHMVLFLHMCTCPSAYLMPRPLVIVFKHSRIMCEPLPLSSMCSPLYVFSMSFHVTVNHIP